MPSVSLEEVIQKELENPKFRKAYEALDDDIPFQMSLLIEDLRVSHGLTQARFAKKLGMKQPSIARIESGRSIPTLAFLRHAADTFKLKLILPHFEPRKKLPRAMHTRTKNTAITVARLPAALR